MSRALPHGHREYVATIDHLTRRNSSRNGNPAWRIHFVEGGYADTQADAGVSYGLGNSENLNVPVTIRSNGSRPRVRRSAGH